VKSVRWRVSRAAALVRLDVEYYDEEGEVVAGFSVDMDAHHATSLGVQLRSVAKEVGAAGQERQRQQPTLRRGH
jgi:hypothetical protein